MKRSHAKRKNKLPKPSLQLRLVGAFLGIMVLSLLLQLLLFGQYLTELSVELSLGGDELRERMPALLLGILGYSFGVLVPATIGIGILLTFRTAGPIYRFEQYLAQVARGEDVGPCRIRDRDELQDLCRLINDALEVTRKRARAAGPATAERPREEAA